MTELKRLSFSPLQWQQAGYDLKRMKKEGFTAAELISRIGADLRSLVSAGCTVVELRGAGVHLSQLMQLVVHPVYELAFRCSKQRLKQGWFSLNRVAEILPWYALSIGVSLFQKRTLVTRGSALCLKLVRRLNPIFRSSFKTQVCISSALCRGLLLPGQADACKMR